MRDKSEIQNKIEEIGQANIEINSITIVSYQGLIIAHYDSKIVDENGEGEHSRLGAMILASQALTNKTLGSLSYDQCKIFTVKAEKANTGMIFSDRYSILVVTDKISDIKSITSSTYEIIHRLMES
jgi:predicted regulator of Ras-like GTPase activity (Roadblock/LC7/MglB family)